MFPIEFNHTMLDSLPVLHNGETERVGHILKAILIRRVIPFFKKYRGADPIAIARLYDKLSIERMEDEDNNIRLVSLVAAQEQGWVIGVHERVFDYFAFVIPSHADARLGEGGAEEQKMLAFVELMLKHQFEQLLYPRRTARELIVSDIKYITTKKALDPTFYYTLLKALNDDLNGLKGGCFRILLERAETAKPYSDTITHVLNTFVDALVDVPEPVLKKLYKHLDIEIKTKVLGACFRKSGETSYSLLTRTLFLQKLLRLFVLLMEGDQIEAEQVFDAFRSRWGLVQLFRELDISEAGLEGKSSQEVFALFRANIAKVKGVFPPPRVVVAPPAPQPKAVESAQKSIKERVEEARENPAVPRSAIEVMDKNKLNAASQSGSKYSELIETLLAIPWGKITPINITAQAFEEGLNSSHHGLLKQKEIICDFFSNLIWRYREFSEEDVASWTRTGSSFLFVGPPGVGKTSLAISVAKTLGIPYHKVSLGGMRDEADLKGHGFSYEGSKPGAILQGLVKMGSMNGMMILDEADKTEKFAIAPLLEMLDPEQNHLFHDKYIQTTVDIDLSNIHFILTANTLETVPSPIINRCEVVTLDRYSVDEKIEIAKRHLVDRVRRRYAIPGEQVTLAAEFQDELLKHIIKNFTHEAGVRQLERVIRTLFLRGMRREVMSHGAPVVIDFKKIRDYLDRPRPYKTINEYDSVGEMMALGVNTEYGIGALIPIQATPLQRSSGDSRSGHVSSVHATGNIEKIMDESRKVAMTAILHCAEALRIDAAKLDTPIHLHFMHGATPKDGPSAGSAIAIALASVLTGMPVRRDVAMTGEIDTQGRVSAIGGLDIKLETALDAGCKTVIIPFENLTEDKDIEKLSSHLKAQVQILTFQEWLDNKAPFDHERHTAQIIAVEHIAQAAQVALVDSEEIHDVEHSLISHARSQAAAFSEKAARRLEKVVLMTDEKDLELLDDNPFLDEFTVVAPPKVAESLMSAMPDGPQVLEFDTVAATPEDLLRYLGNANPAATETLVIGKRSLLIGLAEGSDHNFTFLALDDAAQKIDVTAAATTLLKLSRYFTAGEDLAGFPFLTESHKVIVPDLEFIPEKYRLDTKRAVSLYKTALSRWVTSMRDTTNRRKRLEPVMSASAPRGH